MDFTNSILESSIKYLHSISELIPNNIPAAKSYYASKSRILELKGNMYLPSRLTKSSMCCTRCCLSYTDYPPSVVLKPKKKVTRAAKKIQKKMDQNKPITLSQQKYCMNINTHYCGKITKICQHCKNETGTFVKHQSQENVETDLTDISTPTTKNKKKRKKDKLCGLTPNAVLRVEEEEIHKPQKVGNINSSVATILSNFREQEELDKQCKKKKKPVVEQKSSKDKILEKKNLKSKAKLNNLLKGSINGKPKNILKNFLNTL